MIFSISIYLKTTPSPISIAENSSYDRHAQEENLISSQLTEVGLKLIGIVLRFSFFRDLYVGFLDT